MRSFTSILWAGLAFGLLAACTGNMATPGAGASSDLIQNSVGTGLPPKSTDPDSRAGTGLPPTSTDPYSRRGTGLPPKSTNPDLGVVGVVALRTFNGDFVTAIGGGGGPKEPNCNPGAVALHDDATRIGPWETFKLVSLHSSGGPTHRYAFQTSNGKNYVTAVDGGGIGASSSGYPGSEMLTNATRIGPAEAFRIIPVGSATSKRVAIQTPDGKHYVSAVNGGGCGGPDDVPFHTNAQTIGPWEEFTLVAID